MTDFARLAARLDGLAADLSPEGMDRTLRRVGDKLARKVDAAVVADIGDNSMSGWRRGRPIPVKGRSTVRDGVVSITPTAPGPARVLEQGRNTGGAGGMAGPGVLASGLTARTKSGAVKKVRARKVRRWNGYTQGKGTWSDASDAIVGDAARVLNEEKVAAMARHFTRG